MTKTSTRMPPSLSCKLMRDIEDILRVATNSVADETGRWLLLEFTRTNGLPTLRFLVDPGGRAHATLSLRKDRTLSYKLRDGSHQDSLLEDHHLLYRDLKDHLAYRIAQKALNQSPWSKTTMFQALSHKQSRESLSSSLDDRTNHLAERLCCTAIMPSGHRECHISDFPTLPRRLIRTHFINQEILEISNRIQYQSVCAYNFAARNLTLINDIKRQEYHTMQYLLRHLPLDLYRPRPRTLTRRHVEQVIQDQLHLDQDERSLLNPAAWIHDLGYYPHKDNQTRIRNFCTHHAQAGIDRQTAETSAVYASATHRYLSEDGVPQPRWLHVLKLFQQNRDDPDASQVLYLLAERMHYNRPDQPPCAPRDWPQCQREAQLQETNK